MTLDIIYVINSFRSMCSVVPLQGSVVQCCAVQCSAMQCSACSAVQCSAVTSPAVAHCLIVQPWHIVSVQCSAVQCGPGPCHHQ